MFWAVTDSLAGKVGSLMPARRREKSLLKKGTRNTPDIKNSRRESEISDMGKSVREEKPASADKDFSLR